MAPLLPNPQLQSRARSGCVVHSDRFVAGTCLKRHRVAGSGGLQRLCAFVYEIVEEQQLLPPLLGERAYLENRLELGVALWGNDTGDDAPEIYSQHYIRTFLERSWNVLITGSTPGVCFRHPHHSNHHNFTTAASWDPILFAP